MFFILSKVLNLMIVPLTWVWILLALSFIVKTPKIKTRLRWCCFAVVLLFGNSFLVDEAMRLWEVPAIELKKDQKFEYGIVLSGMVVWDARFNRINFNGNVDRVLQVLPKHYEGQIKNLLISGGDGTLDQSSPKEADLLKEYFSKIGYPVDRIVVESESKNTFENAQFSAHLLRDSLKVDIAKQPILLITSSMHMRRSQAIFKKQGFNCVAYVTNRISGPRKWDFDHIVIPHTEAMSAWRALLHEVLGYITYQLMGYL